MNILLTNSCNRRCRYCFAQERVSVGKNASPTGKAPPVISREDFAYAIDFAVKSRIDNIGLLGGEPSIHPQFTTLLEDVWERDIKIKVFTNGLWRERDIRFVERAAAKNREKTTFVVNVNGPTVVPEEHERQEYFLSRLGSICSLSFNISRADFDPFFLIDLINKYGTRRMIRLGVAQPLAKLDNEHIDVADYRSMVPTIMKLTDRCDEHNISLGFDCGFVLCMFNNEELGRLTVAGARFRASCGPALDIGTDLTAWACFPLSTFAQGEHLTDFEDAEHLNRFFREKLEPLFSTGALPECVSCRHRKRNQCPGGCAAHVYRRMDPCFQPKKASA